MKFDLHTQRYVDWKVYNVTPIKNKYGFRVKLIYADGTSTIQQKSGYTSKKAAEQARTEIIGQLYANAYVVYENILLEEFLEFWLEDVMRPKMKNSSYVSYRNSIHRHINPHLGKVKLTKLNRGHIQQLYNKEMKVSESAVKLVKTVMNTAMGYAMEKKIISVNPAEDVDLPKQKPKTEFRVRHIDEQKTLNQEQVDRLIEAAKDTPIYLQVMFAVLMGLRRSEIIAVKYSDIDYINRTLHVERQKYEKNRRRRINDKHNPFFDGNYVCCSTYGKPRSKDFHWVHFKKLLKENGLPDIRWHDLRATYCTILLKNDFNPKAVSKLMGHAKEIITIDVYGDNREIIEDCLENLEPFIDEVLPEEEVIDLCDVDCMDLVASELIE